MKYLFVGDIHNRYEIMKTIVDFGVENGYKMVFVGDYVDSFKERYSEGEKCLKLAVELCNDHIFILGNHDLHYLDDDFIHAGYNENFRFSFNSYLKQLRKRFSFAIDDILVTHAGLTEKAMNFSMSEKCYKNEKLDAELISSYIETECVDHSSSLLTQMGRARGGKHSVGGILWCDFYGEFAPLPNITQIFGHTMCREFLYVEYDKTMQQRHKTVEELEGCGWQYNRGMLYPKQLEFVRAKGIEHLKTSTGNDTYNIDCLTHSIEVLEYDTDTKEFKIHSL